MLLMRDPDFGLGPLMLMMRAFGSKDEPHDEPKRGPAQRSRVGGIPGRPIVEARLASYSSPGARHHRAHALGRGPVAARFKCNSGAAVPERMRPLGPQASCSLQALPEQWGDRECRRRRFAAIPRG